MDRAVLCVLKTPQQAELVVDSLRAAGFASSDISLLLADRGETQALANETRTMAPEGAATGAGAGGLLGGSLGWLMGIGTLAIPGVGPFVAAGPIIATLSGAAVGAAMGGLTGALIGMGVPETVVEHYEGRLTGGNVLISVHTEQAQQREVAREIFEKAGGEDIHTAGEEGLGLG